ncbi:hypothetical protein NDU88_005216 [Pleurodeles waltl]|uniref:Uncharacterized protein n=1 Tax=Pleurodeles waltl TaxID=8319 RepID=A0AAV7T9S7_PLEWA|nr:hypothetical protein NDU88_005216 [Pleurodeles waltl]
MQGPATPLTSFDFLADSEEGSGLPPFTGSPCFLGLEHREALPLSLTVRRSPLLHPLPASLSPGDSGPPPPAPGGSLRNRYRTPPWCLRAAARGSPHLAANRVPGANVSADAEEGSGWAPLTG